MKKDLIVRLHTLEFREALLDDLLLARLHREVSHGKGDLVLARIAVLRDQIAGVTGERQIIDFAARSRADFDHFPDVRKMVHNWVS